jgi:pimeloyl-ACP methyl ester carboxylesterase
MIRPGPAWRERFVDADGVSLHVVEAGPADGPLVVLLHGFPEFWYGWRHQIEPLAAAGYRVLVPDQRGYNTSDKPRRVADYRIERLARDVLALIDNAGRDVATVVGHDWGAAVAWWLGSHHPERLERLGILNVPHPFVMRRHLLTNPRQIRRSWYIFFFQVPFLAEAWLRRRNGRMAERILLATSRAGAFGDEDIARYREAWARPQAMRSMVNWYRAAIRGAARPFGPTRVPIETLIIWGSRDAALGREMVAPSLELCDRGRAVFFENASHWVQHEEAESVTRLLKRFLAKGLDGLRHGSGP